MLDDARTNEQRYFDALKTIRSYESIEWIRKNAEREYGLQYPEALEYAYENMQQEARAAIHGKRRPTNWKGCKK